MKSIQSIKLNKKIIGHHYPCFIIAEAGVNHNGDLKIAKKLIIEAKKAGANCVKFQTFEAEKVAKHNAPKASYQKKNNKQKSIPVTNAEIIRIK